MGFFRWLWNHDKGTLLINLVMLVLVMLGTLYLKELATHYYALPEAQRPALSGALGSPAELFMYSLMAFFGLVLINAVVYFRYWLLYRGLIEE